MKINSDGFLELELHEIIRVNQLIRINPKINEFVFWFNKLSKDEQTVLSSELYEFLCQTGVYDKILMQVSSGINKHTKLFEKLNSFEGDIDSFEDWYVTLNLDERLIVFEFVVTLFARAENYIFENESVEECNHWWHRDLTNPEVVKSILNDPNYFNTSRSDDE